MLATVLTRRLAISIAAFLILVGAAVPRVTSASSERHPAGAGGTISVVYSSGYLFDADSQAAAFWASIKKQFEKQNPGSTLNLVPEPGLDTDELNKINLMLRSSSTAPDVLSIPTYPVGSLVQSGYLAPLNSYVKNWSLWKDFPAGVRNENKIGKTVWAVNTGNNDFGLLYSMPLFRKAGISVPWQPKSWADILSALRKIKTKDKGVYGMQVRVGSANGYSTALKGFANWIVGAKQHTILDPKTGKWVVSSKGLLDTFQFFHTAVSQGLIGPATDQTMLTPTGSIVWKWMPAQKYAVVVGGNWYPGLWLPGQGGTPWPGANKVYSVAKIPTESGQKPGYASAIGGWAYAITKASSHKALAWKLIQLLEQTKNSVTLANQSGVVPPSTKVFNSKAFLDFVKPYNKQYNDIIRYGTSLPNRPGILQYEQALNDTSGQLISDSSMTAQQALSKFKGEATQLIGSNQVETIK